MTEPTEVERAFRGPFPGRPLQHVAHGISRVQRAEDLDAWQLILPPSGRLTHLTAAEAYGWWMPETPQRLPVYIAVDAGTSRVLRSGVRGIRTDPFGPPGKWNGLRLDSPADVLLNAARDLSLLDLVVLVSSALHDGKCTLEELRAAAARRRRGAPRLRKALEYADGRCESAWEVLLLVLHKLGGYDVEPQHVVRDTAGDEVARLDLWLVDTSAAHEYDGAHHREGPQHDKDLGRDRRLIAVGITRRGYVAKDLISRPHSILRDCELSTGMPPAPGAASRWLRMLEESTYTPPGRARLVRRCWTLSSTP
jgi:hypothetical protein